ncbi:MULTISPECIES: NepR family anti-sigma factor [Roseivivax]
MLFVPELRAGKWARNPSAREMMAHDQPSTKRDDVIDENLKKVYRDMLEQDVPDRFLDLLSQLKEQDEAKVSNSGENDE